MNKIFFNSRDEFPYSTGVYAIYFLNSLNDKIYIGSASKFSSKYDHQNGFKNRWKKHLYKLRKNNHPSIKLQNAYNKYGENNLIFEVIEECEPIGCLDKEQFYINLFNSCLDGYNSRPIANSQLGFRHSEKTKNAIFLIYKKKRDLVSDEAIKLYLEGKTAKEIGKILNTNYHRILKIFKENNFVGLRRKADYIKIAVYQYTLEGNIIKKWGSPYECARDLKIHESGIRKVLNNEQKHSGGFFFSRKEMSKDQATEEISFLQGKRDLKSKESYTKSFTPERLKRMSENGMGKQRRKRIQNIKQLDKNGNLIKIWLDSKEIVDFYKLKNASPILRVIKGERKHFKKFKWTT